VTLADALDAGPIRKAKRCGVGKWLDTLDPRDRAKFDAILPLAIAQTPPWNVSKMHEVCAVNGLTMNRDALGKHANGTCCCDPR
jgi:hypothetical protein